jgi:basic membrane protein A
VLAAAAASLVGFSAVVARGAPTLRVGLVLEQPLVGRGDDPFQHGAYLGLLRAQRELHIEAKAVAPSPTAADPWWGAFAYLGRQKYDLVLALGFLEIPDLPAATRRFPSVKFGLIDATREDVKSRPRNLAGTIFRTEQPSYLAGYLAAKMADRRPGRHVISSVGGYAIPPVQAFIAGFQAGARRADPKITLLNTYTGDFLNPAKCEHAALDQIARGSQVVFDVAGACGLGALQAAKQKGVWGIGVDIDQSYLGPFILTSVVKNAGQAVYEFARRLVDGTLRMGGNLRFDFTNHGVELGRFSPQVPAALRRELVRLQAEISRGEIVVPAALK